MRKQININTGWMFSKEDHMTFYAQEIPANEGTLVDIPHTWNALDGQDGGNDYYRGGCWYQKNMVLPEISENEVLYLEFAGVNSVADVYIDGELLTTHAGGYSKFRMDISKFANKKEVLLSVRADNSDNPNVYPRTADYTFFGGIYRDVTLQIVPKTHFAMNEYASCGVYIDTEVKENIAEVVVRSKVENTISGMKVCCEVLDDKLQCVAKNEMVWSKAPLVLGVHDPHLWHGRKSPYMYTLRAMLMDENNQCLDEIEVPFGIRSFYVDSEKGFYLNGESYHLHGVSRHQDRKDKGWAIGKSEHEEDMDLICEIGASSIRLAHYQHDEYFYDLCDQRGMVVWAEIPFISQMTKKLEANENLMSQMNELILQNYNHPSICFWGLQNETTIHSMGEAKEDKELVEMVQSLHNLCKELNSARLTCQACLGNVPGSSHLATISDLTSYNHYFGWYVGEVGNLESWFDKFHKDYPGICVGLSEYGGDGSVRYHSDKPRGNDYTEEYQAMLHEESEAILMDRPYIWSHYVWNMFDFGSDRRDEGGAPGLNQKGLITYDRKVKKDAFYLYKAYWSEVPFVHICGHTYINRTVKAREIKVYSNQPQVQLFINGKEVEGTAQKHIFRFTVTLEHGENSVVAIAGDVREELILNGVDKYDKSYKMTELEGKAGIVNWFENADDFHFVEGTYSINDRISEILENEEGRKVLEEYFAPYMKMDMLAMAKNFKLAKMISKLGAAFPNELAIKLNAELAKIEKPDNE